MNEKKLGSIGKFVEIEPGFPKISSKTRLRKIFETRSRLWKDVLKCPLSTGENRTSLSAPDQKLFKKQPSARPIGIDSSSRNRINKKA